MLETRLIVSDSGSGRIRTTTDSALLLGGSLVIGFILNTNIYLTELLRRNAILQKSLLKE